MTSLHKKSGRQWPFLGQEVTSLEDLTSTHIRVVYGLGPNTDERQTETPRGKNGGDRSNAPFPYCGNRYAKSGVENSESTKGSSTCTAARCKDGNPHCLNYMGQDQWEKEDALDRYFGMITIKPDPMLSKRPVDTPAGMKNLGATCYANSLLQVWFHDLAFRDAIYRCRFSEDADNSMNALYQLQLLFTHLDKGLKSHYNPLSLVKSLKLDTAMQQDAQEFCNLFMARIDNQLQIQQDCRLGDFIKNQFQGHYSYNTTCKNCLRTSARDCTFYELMLNIKDNCTLMDCLEEFVEPEELVGADRYSCSICGSLQDASREIKLNRLPNALNIQLMRFVYDNVTWTKKKSKDTIKFPQSIDFSQLLRSSESVIYDLSAVLVHSGPSAHSGHFLAHVLNKENNKWFVLNDEEVTEFHGTRFDPEDYSEIASKAKTRKAAVKGDGEAEKLLNTLSSRNAYMLTYVRRASELPIKPSSPPNETLEIVQQDNAKLEIEIKEYEEYKKKVKDDFDRLRDKRRELYRCWGVDSDEDNGYYVSSEALAKYIQSDDDLSQTLDNSSIACEHGKLCPSTVVRSKRISKSAMQLLEVRDQIKVDPVLTMEDFCDICIRKICQDKLYTLMHRRDTDEFERKAKGIRSPPAVWVSKAWLTDWLKVSPRFHPENGTTADDPSPLSKAYITDVLCQHSSLSIDKSRRKQINKAASPYDILALALGVLTRIFGEMSLPESNSVECSVCRDRLQPQRDNIMDMTSRAASEKFELSGMVMRGARFRHMEHGKNYYAVSKEGFMKKWLDFVKRPTVNVRPTAIDNSSLLCRHDQFVFDLNNEIDMENDNDLFVVNEEEWAILQAMYGGGPKILITKTEAIQTDCEYTSTQSVTDSDPSLCSTCRIERILDFSSTTLVIRVYTPGKDTDDNGSTAGGQTPTESPEVVSKVPPSNKLSKAKRKQAPPVPEGEFGARRSKRVKAVKKSYKEIKVPVSKYDTVMDLKLKIMQKTEIVPLYQKLLHEKVELENNDSTIADLKIPPNAILDLIAFDQSADDLDLSNLQDVVSTPGDEGGFGGTGLTEDWQ